MAFQFALLLLTIIVPLNGYTLINSGPPPHKEAAKMARYVIHNIDWVSIATVSTQQDIPSYPFANVKSMSDGPVSNGTGVPYFYISPMDFTGIDIVKDARCTILATLAETTYCNQKHFDPQDPRCARIIISGHLLKVADADEYKFAKNALFSRHPAMKYWPVDHNWYIAKVDMTLIIVLDYFGGAQYVSKEDYFNANINSFPFEKILYKEIEVVEVTA